MLMKGGMVKWVGGEEAENKHSSCSPVRNKKVLLINLHRFDVKKEKYCFIQMVAALSSEVQMNKTEANSCKLKLQKISVWNWNESTLPNVISNQETLKKKLLT